ncbi:MAG: serine/threonine protein kinase [Myxococcales bacterium]|nr:serine/threonine protein kinase [Myxococcales bacterium]
MFQLHSTENTDITLASVGDSIGPYRITAPLSVGGMSECYLAEPERGGDAVVLKLASRGTAAHVEALVREAAVLRRLRHRSIVGKLGVVESERVFGIALQRVHGQELGAKLAREGEQPFEAVVSWVWDLAAALDHVHAQGLLHGDVKPGNVLIVEDGSLFGRAVLIDFGLSRNPGVRIGKGRGATLMGTPHYMAPEQVLGRVDDIGFAADRYALAALALEALTGHRPYASLSTGRLLRTILEEAPRAPSVLGLLGAHVDSLFSRALARDPKARFGSSSAFAHELEETLRGARRVQRHDSLRPHAPTVPASYRAADRAA